MAKKSNQPKAGTKKITTTRGKAISRNKALKLKTSPPALGTVKVAITPALSPAEEEKAEYIESIRKLFRLAGFTHIDTDGLHFTYQGKNSEIDDIFLYDNVLIICEQTSSKKENVWTHLNNKDVLYRLVEKDPPAFVDFMTTIYSSFKGYTLDKKYPSNLYKIIILYCSKHGVESRYKAAVSPIVRFLDFPILYYFITLTNTIKKSARFELFSFFGLTANDIGKAAIKPNSGSSAQYPAFILPEIASSFAKGYKVVTFYIDPETLIERAFVLRRSGWKEVGILYQRPLVAKKVNSMREHLRNNKGVFINNIIATLPSNVTFDTIDEKNPKPIDPDKLVATTAVKITIPNEFNSICLIDGQHRVFSYHEGNDSLEDSIKSLREMQNLLVTAVCYPHSIREEEKAQFEASLFVSINSTQTSAKSELIQEIETIIHPFSIPAIAREVIQELNSFGVLQDRIEMYPFETDKLKATTIVTYGLKPIVKLGGKDSIFTIWNNTQKPTLPTGTDLALLDDYKKFVSKTIETFISAFRQVIVSESAINKWTSDTNGVIKIIVINGLINCLRLMIENNKIGDRNSYVQRFKGVGSFNFTKHSGSRWKGLGDELYRTYFK